MLCLDGYFLLFILLEIQICGLFHHSGKISGTISSNIVSSSSCLSPSLEFPLDIVWFSLPYLLSSVTDTITWLTQQSFPTSLSLAGFPPKKLKNVTNSLPQMPLQVRWPRTQSTANQLEEPQGALYLSCQRGKRWGSCSLSFPFFLLCMWKWCLKLGSHIQPQKDKYGDKKPIH